MTLHHQQPPEPVKRRLLSGKQVAEKFGYKRSWLDNHRNTLEQLGFPEPILGGGMGSPLRWDERAIDLWLDSKMPVALREYADDHRINVKNLDTRNIEQQLQQRAAGLLL